MNSFHFNVNVYGHEDLQKCLEILSLNQLLDKSNYLEKIQCKIVVSIDFLFLYINNDKHVITLSDTNIALKELADIDNNILCVLYCFSNQNIILDEIIKTHIYSVAAQKRVKDGTIINFKKVDIDSQTHFDFDFVKSINQSQLQHNHISISGVNNIQIHTGTGDNVHGDKKVYNIEKIDKADFS